MDFDSLKGIGNITGSMNTINNSMNNLKSSDKANAEIPKKEASLDLKDVKDVKSIDSVLSEIRNEKENKNEDAANKEKVAANKDKLEKAFEIANEGLKMANVNKKLTYDIHEKTNQIIVKITDKDTGEVLREVPSEESLDLYVKIQEMAGLMIDQKR